MFDLDNADFFDIRNNFKQYSDVESTLLYGIRMKDRLLSIMIPTFLRNSYLKDTIESALAQKTDMPFEIVVVDNNSDLNNSDTLEVVKQFDDQRVSYYKNSKNLGMFGNWNRCLELANSEWVLILHDDDIIEEHYISNMMTVIRNNPNIGAVACKHNLMDENGKIDKGRKESFKWRAADQLIKRKILNITTKDFYFIHPVNIMGILLNRSKAIETGGFDDRWYPTSDYVFILNLVDRYPVKLVWEHLLDYRVAVNASLSLKHLIGMVEVDAFMRKNINERLKIFPAKVDLMYRSSYSLDQQAGIKKRWITALQNSEKEDLYREYDRFNKYMGFRNKFSFLNVFLSKIRRGYLFYLRYIRKNQENAI